MLLTRCQQVAEGLTYIAGKSTWKFGTDLRWLGYNDLGYAIQNGAYGFNGQYTGSSVGDYLLGLPSYAFSHQAGGSGFTERLRNGEFSFYAQDDIKITPSLTLNAGLRYEYVQYPLEVNNELATWNFQKGTLDFAGSDIPRRILRAGCQQLGTSPGIGLHACVLEKNGDSGRVRHHLRKLPSMGDFAVSLCATVCLRKFLLQ